MKELTLMELHKKDAEARIRSKEFAKLCVHSVPPYPGSHSSRPVFVAPLPAPGHGVGGLITVRVTPSSRDWCRYEVVKNERNGYVNAIQASSQALAEMKERIKILHNEVEILQVGNGP
jgi:hypothetical protein